MPVLGSRGCDLWELMVKEKQQILSSDMKIGLTYAIHTYDHLLLFSHQYLPILICFFSFVLESHFPSLTHHWHAFPYGKRFLCVACVPQAPGGTPLLPAKCGWEAALQIGLFEDLQDLTSRMSHLVFSPPFHAYIHEHMYIWTWTCGPLFYSHSVARAHPLEFPCAPTVNTAGSTFPTNNMDPLSRSCKIRGAVSSFRLAFHVWVQKLDECFKPFRMPASRGRLYWWQVLMKQRCNGQALYLVLSSLKVI